MGDILATNTLSRFRLSRGCFVTCVSPIGIALIPSPIAIQLFDDFVNVFAYAIAEYSSMYLDVCTPSGMLGIGLAQHMDYNISVLFCLAGGNSPSGNLAISQSGFRLGDHCAEGENREPDSPDRNGNVFRKNHKKSLRSVRSRSSAQSGHRDVRTVSGPTAPIESESGFGDESRTERVCEKGRASPQS